MFEGYLFLFVLAGIVALFAAIQDVRKTVVANWLNFVFVASALAYGAFYSINISDWRFFIYGLLGVCVMFLFANLLYYTRVFGGGDAKLLMGFGAILPYSNLKDIFILCVLFLFVLFFIGSIYSLVCSVVISIRKRKKFSKLFKEKIKVYKKLNQKFVIAVFAFGFFSILVFGELFGTVFISIIAIFYFGYAFLGSVDELMIVKRSPYDLMEGDWLNKEIKIGRKLIKKSVHGLSEKDIKFLKKKKKSVYIKKGIPFVPVFLLTWIMVFSYFFLELPFVSFLF